MKTRIIAALTLFAMFSTSLHAATTTSKWATSDVQLSREGNLMTVKFNLDLSAMNVESARAVVFTPMLINGADSLVLPQVGVFGRKRYLHYERGDGNNVVPEKPATVYQSATRPATHAVNEVVAYHDWMNGAHLTITERSYGCCRTPQTELTLAKDAGTYQEAPVIPDMPKVNPFQPLYVHVKGDGTKVGHLEGKAWVQFEVNKTVIKPEKYNNPRELAKITSSIDTVKNDPDATITKVWLKGFASPESPYAHNTQLAKGRVAALRDYVQQLYKFKSGIIETDYEPEDWDGLRAYVAGSNITNREAILQLINREMDPDEKEKLIKKTYPKEYRFLLDYAYPPLRHTEYRIEYTIKQFTNVEDIKRVMHGNPSKLSQNEFYLVASTYEPGTPAFNEVFETCVRVYPTDSIANLNAATAALIRSDFESADAYLLKAGEGAEASYARGMSDLLQHRFESARPHLEKALAGGVKQAQKALDNLAEIEAYIATYGNNEK